MSKTTDKTVTAIRKFFDMSIADMRREWTPLSPALKLEFANMLPAVGINPTDRAELAARVAAS